MYQVQPTILDGLVLPPGLDEAVLKTNLLIECAELEVLYSDADFLEMAISAWSDKQLPTWRRLYDDEMVRYNPIENYDRMENWTDDTQGNRSITSRNTAGSTVQNSGTDLDSATGYNSDAMKKTGQTERSSVTTDSSSVNGSGTEDNTINSVHAGRVHGNIGVVTPMEMLSSDIELVPRLNTYNAIIADFKRRFCLMVY